MRHFIPFVLALAPLVVAVDRNNFKTCKDSSFCERRRKFEGEGEKYKGRSSNTIYFIPKFCTLLHFGNNSECPTFSNRLTLYPFITDYVIPTTKYRLSNTNYVISITYHRLM